MKPEIQLASALIAALALVFLAFFLVEISSATAAIAFVSAGVCCMLAAAVMLKHRIGTF